MAKIFTFTVPSAGDGEVEATGCIMRESSTLNGTRTELGNVSFDSPPAGFTKVGSTVTWEIDAADGTKYYFLTLKVVVSGVDVESPQSVLPPAPSDSAYVKVFVMAKQCGLTYYVGQNFEAQPDDEMAVGGDETIIGEGIDVTDTVGYAELTFRRDSGKYRITLANSIEREFDSDTSESLVNFNTL